MNLILKQLMKNSLIVVFLSSCFLYSSGNEDIEIKDFFKNLYNKTVILEINQQSVSYNANLSINSNQIFFDTAMFDGTISVFKDSLISSYDLNEKIIILENAEKNFLEFFDFENFENAKLISINTINNYSSYHYNYLNNKLLIKFDDTKKQVYSISLTQFDKIVFDCFVGSVESFQDPLTNLKVDDTWQVIDWR
jgi:hypothetical protein